MIDVASAIEMIDHFTFHLDSFRPALQNSSPSSLENWHLARAAAKAVRQSLSGEAAESLDFNEQYWDALARSPLGSID